AAPVTKAVIDRLSSNQDALIVVNFANPDMVGHTGDLDATVKSVEFGDGCLGKIADATTSSGGGVVLTADHGNAEQKINPKDNSPLTAHTTEPVPLIVY